MPFSDEELHRAQMVLRRYAGADGVVTGRGNTAIRPFHADGYVNVLNKYGTKKDTNEHYQFEPEQRVPDEKLTRLYEGNGLFAKIIDTPAEEAVKHGFDLTGLKDDKIEKFYLNALDELNFEEVASTAIKWSRLYGGAVAVMLIDDGRELSDPLDWKSIRSIDEIRVFERAIVWPDYSSLYSYDPSNPFARRSSRFMTPEYYIINSMYGVFKVHESRCMVFRNGILPERVSNQDYQLWGMPEYIRIKDALKDSIIAHGDAPKMLDKSVQAVYKMKGLAEEVTTDDGEERVLRRLEMIDMARGLLNSISIDADGEDYDFRTFQFSGVKDVVDTTSQLLAAVTSIPQAILFGEATGGMSSTDDTSMENYYNFIERIQKMQLRNNLRDLLSVIFQAGCYTGEIDEIPEVHVSFKPLWSLSETEMATIEKTKADTQLVRAQTSIAYVQAQILDATEVRRSLAKSDEFDVENILDEGEPDDEDLLASISDPLNDPNENSPKDGSENSPDPNAPTEAGDPNASPNAPEATASPEEKAEGLLEALDGVGDSGPDKAYKHHFDEHNNFHNETDNVKSVGVILVSNGRVLTGVRCGNIAAGKMCGPGGHIELGETPEQAAIRETQEEFGITPTDLTLLGYGSREDDTGSSPAIFLATEYTGEIRMQKEEMSCPNWMSLETILSIPEPLMFGPFAASIQILNDAVFGNVDGGPGSGNFGHKGREGEIGGSAPGNGSTSTSPGGMFNAKVDRLKKQYGDSYDRGAYEYGHDPLGNALSASLSKLSPGTEIEIDQG